MTLGLDRDGWTRLLCGIIWFVMSLAFAIEICALLGWMLGQAERGGWLGAILNCLAWCRLLWVNRHDPG